MYYENELATNFNQFVDLYLPPHHWGKNILTRKQIILQNPWHCNNSRQ